MRSSLDKRSSKFLSRVLRHEPGLIGLDVDAAGWASVTELIARANAAGWPLTRADIDRVLAMNAKQRFRLSADGERIRASQGHSIAVDLGLAPAVPPTHLYHGTAEPYLATILCEGLKPQRRLHVHLSSDPDAARAVGQRHGRPVVLKVMAGRLHREGHLFWQADNGVWLTTAIPPGHLAVHWRRGRS